MNSSKISSAISGLTIGLEIAGSRKFWMGNDVILVGTSPMVDIYQAILKKQKIETKTVNSNSISLIGLKSIYKNYIFYEKINRFQSSKKLTYTKLTYKYIK